MGSEMCIRDRHKICPDDSRTVSCLFPDSSVCTVLIDRGNQPLFLYCVYVMKLHSKAGCQNCIPGCKTLETADISRRSHIKNSESEIKLQ